MPRECRYLILVTRVRQGRRETMAIKPQNAKEIRKYLKKQGLTPVTIKRLDAVEYDGAELRKELDTFQVLTEEQKNNIVAEVGDMKTVEIPIGRFRRAGEVVVTYVRHPIARRFGLAALLIGVVALGFYAYRWKG